MTTKLQINVRVSGGRIALATNLTGRDYTIVRDVTGRGFVAHAKARVGQRFQWTEGEWKPCQK